MPHGFLAAFTTQGSGHYDKAVEEGLKAIELDPDYSIGYENVAFAYIYLNRLSEAEAVLRKASERKIEVIEFSLCRYFIAFLRNDKAAMEREMTQRQAKLEAQGSFEHQEALTLAYQGRLKEADRLSDRAVILSRQAGLRERAAQFEGARAAWNALFGIRAGGDKEALRRRCRCTEAGTPTMDLPLRWRFCTIPRKLTRSRRTSKSATRRTHLSNSVTCLRCGRSKLSTRATQRKRSK